VLIIFSYCYSYNSTKSVLEIITAHLIKKKKKNSIKCRMSDPLAIKQKILYLKYEQTKYTDSRALLHLSIVI